MSNMAAMLIYGNNLKKSSRDLWIWLTNSNKPWYMYVTPGTLAQYSLYKSWPLVDLDLVYGKYGHIGVSKGQSGNITSESFVACILTVGRYRQLTK